VENDGGFMDDNDISETRKQEKLAHHSMLNVKDGGGDTDNEGN